VFGPLTTPAAGADVSVVEGRALLRLHKVAERKPAVVLAKKRAVLAAASRLVCEACGFDFASVYGPLGDGFAECHHRLPFAAAGERRTELEDLAVVCANCHRMLHRRPWRGVEALRKLIRSRRSGQA
jgi:5-methylcytosine-specific restriction protein A